MTLRIESDEFMPGKRILIIEDDIKLLRLYTKMLDTDHDVIQCSTLHDARELLKTETFDAIICDMQVGMHRSTELLWDYYRQWQRDKVNVVVISGKEFYQSICEQLGLPFLLKPVDLQTLRTAVAG
jgi:DNA-binding NtrC family response regulator